jgi:cytochrome c oxidase cbb3-type subunit IV
MNMDADTLRSILTVLSFVTFLGIVAWAWTGRARDRFEQASRLPFDEEEGF